MKFAYLKVFVLDKDYYNTMRNRGGFCISRFAVFAILLLDAIVWMSVGALLTRVV